MESIETAVRADVMSDADSGVFGMEPFSMYRVAFGKRVEVASVACFGAWVWGIGEEIEVLVVLILNFCGLGEGRTEKR